MMNKETTENKLYLYWLTKEHFAPARDFLVGEGYSVSPAMLTPCQVLRASGRDVIYASPEVWSRICVRQGSWYRSSKRSGRYMMVSAVRLPERLDEFLDSEISESDFMPKSLPVKQELQKLVETDEYKEKQPDEWEDTGIKDAFMFKVLFTLTRFWRQGDNLNKHWLSQRANHANFLARRFTTEIDGENVAYSVTENAGICSSCAEFFNIVDDRSRKLVRACPGSVTFGGAPRDTYLDIKPKDTGPGREKKAG